MAFDQAQAALAMSYDQMMAQVDSMADVEQSSEWEDFDAAARRPIEQHIRNSFIHTYKPVLDDAEYRSFETMEEYRHWCQENLPDWLGYSRDQVSTWRHSN